LREKEKKTGRVVVVVLRSKLFLQMIPNSSLRFAGLLRGFFCVWRAVSPPQGTRLLVRGGKENKKWDRMKRGRRKRNTTETTLLALSLVMLRKRQGKKEQERINASLRSKTLVFGYVFPFAHCVEYIHHSPLVDASRNELEKRSKRRSFH